MDDKTREKVAEQIIETVHSLENALTIARGGDCASLETMKGMSLFHFICHVAAPNGIRFVRVPVEVDNTWKTNLDKPLTNEC